VYSEDWKEVPNIIEGKEEGKIKERGVI